MFLDNALLDTGSGGTIFKMDKIDELGITIEKDDNIETISGVGGIEFVCKNNIDGKERYILRRITLDEIRPTYRFNETCQDSVPQAIVAFLESISFEDAIKNAISIGGDSDTIAAITGSIAEAYYGIPEKLSEFAMSKLDDRLMEVVQRFTNKYISS